MTTNQKKALFKGLANSLIIEGKIRTTASKAREVRGITEKLVSKARKNTPHVRRQLLAFLGNAKAVEKLLVDLGPRFSQRPGGFLRVIKIGARLGDNAEMVEINFVDQKRNETLKN